MAVRKVRSANHCLDTTFGCDLAGNITSITDLVRGENIAHTHKHAVTAYRVADTGSPRFW
jgi:hypothetical protein